MGLSRVTLAGTGLALLVSSIPMSSDVVASVWTGIYTEAQARRGELIYPAICGRCHGYKLDGAPDDPDMFSTPPIAGPKFLRNWNGRSLAALFEYTRTQMPQNNPGFMSDQEAVDVVTYMLLVGGIPAGPIELVPEITALSSIVFEEPVEPGAALGALGVGEQ